MPSECWQVSRVCIVIPLFHDIIWYMRVLSMRVWMCYECVCVCVCECVHACVMYGCLGVCCCSRSACGGSSAPQINLWLRSLTAAHRRPQTQSPPLPWCYANVNSCHFQKLASPSLSASVEIEGCVCVCANMHECMFPLQFVLLVTILCFVLL